MNDDQLLRYSRQILLSQVDVEGQERLLASRALIIGMGGLGSPVAMYMAAAGVGQLVIVDHDEVDLTNLQRQIVHTTAAVGRPKVESAYETLHGLNPDIEITSIPMQLNEQALAEQVALADVVVDATDNFPTRIAVNQACISQQTPLVWGAAVRMEGQISVVDPGSPEAPCYQCLYKDQNYPTEPCSQLGVFTPVVGMIGTVQANEALKILIGRKSTLVGRLLLLDALSMEWNSIGVPKNPDCKACGTTL